jgi:hypothetical protein
MNTEAAFRHTYAATFDAAQNKGSLRCMMKILVLNKDNASDVEWFLSSSVLFLLSGIACGFGMRGRK